MPVEVKVTAVFQRLVGGARSLAVDGKTVGEVLDNLDRKHPGFKARLLNPDGTLQQFVNIYVNDEDIRFMKQLDTPLNDGDTVSILPALAGGEEWPQDSAPGELRGPRPRPSDGGLGVSPRPFTSPSLLPGKERGGQRG